MQKGENLSTIAKKYYGDYRKYDVIVRYNKIKDATRVNPGQTIKIPSAQGMLRAKVRMPVDKQTTGYVWHTVQAGQSISKLAQIYYGDYKQFHLIARYNEMDDATRVKVGDRVKVPKIAGFPFNVPPEKTALTAAPMQPEPATPRVSSDEEEKSPVKYAYPPDAIPSAGPEHDDEAPTDTYSSGNSAGAETEANEQVLAYRNTGIILYNEGKYEDAIFELNKAVEAAPEDGTTRVYLAKSYFESGLMLFDQQDFEAAREAFESSLQYDARCTDCRAYIEKNKSGPALAYRAGGMAYFNRNEFPAAIAEFEKYLQARPDDAEIRSHVSIAYFRQALIDYNKSEFMTAAKGFRAALAYDGRCDKCTTYIAQSEESFKDAHYKQGSCVL